MITMTDCPPKLRGDLSKWLCEINTGVYVGNLSSRVRDAIWERVCENLKNGRATMVFSTNNEQKMDFRVHNTSWQPVDFDGIQLMRRPLAQTLQENVELKPGFSHAAKRQMAEKQKRASQRKNNSYVVVDLETTGLNVSSDTILEFGAIRVRDGQPVETFSQLVLSEHAIPKTIVELTGIDMLLLQQDGVPLTDALAAFLKFIGQDMLVGYHLSFDMKFLQEVCKIYGVPLPTNRCIDLLNHARRKIYGLQNYKLRTVAKHLSLEVPSFHRALEDCQLLLAVYQKLNEI